MTPAIIKPSPETWLHEETRRSQPNIEVNAQNVPVHGEDRVTFPILLMELQKPEKSPALPKITQPGNKEAKKQELEGPAFETHAAYWPALPMVALGSLAKIWEAQGPFFLAARAVWEGFSSAQ